MMLVLALRSLRTRPVRSAVLAAGFGLGVAVMAALLGVAAVILEQARAPELVGGGDVVVDGPSGRLPNARFVLSAVLANGPLAARVSAASPSERATVYLLDDRGAIPVQARGGIPSLEQALGDRETSGVRGWTDTPADLAWAQPDPEAVLRSMDRFHPIPDVPSRAGSWAEWLYFNGRSSDVGFYLTFLSRPSKEAGRRTIGVRLQLERSGRMTSYAESMEIDEDDLLKTAPDLTVGRNHVRLVGTEYQLSIDLPAESGSARASGTLVLTATPGRSLPPLTLRGAGGWVSGYVVPVMSGRLQGAIDVAGESVSFENGLGYHDHNWGFWEGVSWQWGQVHGERLSFVYGRVRPPADAADPSRVPAFLMAIGPDGPMGYAADVSVDEQNAPGTNRPERIIVRGRGETLNATLDLSVSQAEVTRSTQGPWGANLDFFQLRALYRVSANVQGEFFQFSAAGSAETFRGR